VPEPTPLAAFAALAMAAVMPASAQQVLKVGSTPTGIPFTFLDTKTNTIQGIMVDIVTEVGKDAGNLQTRAIDIGVHGKLSCFRGVSYRKARNCGIGKEFNTASL